MEIIALAEASAKRVEERSRALAVLGFNYHPLNPSEASLKSILTGLVCLLLASAAGAQTSQTPVLKTRPADPNELVPDSAVAPDTPVITVQGLCEKTGNGSATPADCKTVVTRAEFEKIVNAVQPNMPATQRKQFAAQYVNALLFAEKARELGLDKGPDFDERMYLVRLQLLAREAQLKMQRDAGNISEAQINEYYQQHAPDFKTITFERIYVPKQKQTDAAPGKVSADLQAKQTGSEAAMKEEADKLRARAAAGEDFLKLQQEANDFAGSKMKATNVKMENMRKTSIPTTDASIFDLKKGEVSQVFTDPTGYRIYKVEEVQDAPLASVHEEIQRTLQGQNMKSEFESIQNSTKTTFDESYFVTPAPPSLKRPDEAPAPAPKAPSAPGKK